MTKLWFRTTNHPKLCQLLLRSLLGADLLANCLVALVELKKTPKPILRKESSKSGKIWELESSYATLSTPKEWMKIRYRQVTSKASLLFSDILDSRMLSRKEPDGICLLMSRMNAFTVDSTCWLYSFGLRVSASWAVLTLPALKTIIGNALKATLLTMISWLIWQLNLK